MSSSITVWIALVIVCATVWALIKRYETRFVLLASGFLMAFVSLRPMMAFEQFDKSMTRASLIIAICSAMGFAAVVSITKCDVHLVAMLTRPLRRLGVLLLPACMAVTGLCAVAIPSTAGLCAAVGPSMIPILVRAGFRPAIAAGSIVASLIPAAYNPGISHNVFIAKMADMEIMDLIAMFADKTLIVSVFIIAAMTVACFAFGDYKKPEPGKAAGTQFDKAAATCPKKSISSMPLRRSSRCACSFSSRFSRA
ncbi:MAG: hypothetical protein ACFWTZ_09230 [Burkholderia sp.]|jgi:C4-dicarboxylate transporter, DcuC family